MTALHAADPSSAHFRTSPTSGSRFAQGDKVVWRNPSTGAAWGGLTVEFVYPAIGIALVRGWFGRPSLRTQGGHHIESRRIRLCQLTRESAAVVAVL